MCYTMCLSPFMSTSDKAGQSERLRWARNQAGYAVAADAIAAFGWKASTYHAHENGQNGLSVEAAGRYGAAYKVRAGWLLTGDGTPKHDRNGDVASEAAIVSTEHRVGVPDDAIPQLDAQIGMGMGVEAPELVLPIAAGETVVGARVIDTWRIPKSVLQRRVSASLKHLHFVECLGDSMEPRIRDGDVVLIDTSRRVPSPPGIFALWDGFSQTLKRLEIVPNTDPPKVLIIPENGRHTTYERTIDEINVIGRYVGRFTVD